MTIGGHYQMFGVAVVVGVAAVTSDCFEELYVQDLVVVT